MSHPRKRGREVEQRSFPCVPMNPSVLLIKKKHKSHSALQLCASLRGVSQLSASYSNPQLHPARNSTVRNLSARRLKPEECYCSGHSCTSTGLATAATVCVCEQGLGVRGRGEVEEGGQEESKVWKRQLYVFPVLCGLMTKQHIVDSELTHSSGLDGNKDLSSLSPCLSSLPSSSSITLHVPLYVSMSLSLNPIHVHNTHAQSWWKQWRCICREREEDLTHSKYGGCRYVHLKWGWSSFIENIY